LRWTSALECLEKTFLLVGGVALVWAFAVSFELGTLLLNFGSLIEFMD
jgi:hypothetical protein